MDHPLDENQLSPPIKPKILSILQNKFGIPFDAMHITDPESGETILIYQCKQCHTIFTSNNTMKKHVCKNIQTYNSVSSFNPTKTMELYLEAIACEDISLRAAASDCMKRFVDSFKRNFTIPSRNTIRKKIIEFADQIQKKQFDSIKGEYASILIDGAKRYFRNSEGVVIYDWSC